TAFGTDKGRGRNTRTAMGSDDSESNDPKKGNNDAQVLEHGAPREGDLGEKQNEYQRRTGFCPCGRDHPRNPPPCTSCPRITIAASATLVLLILRNVRGTAFTIG